MANTKISALTALTGANVATDDVFPVVDTSVTTTKKITAAELRNAVTPCTLSAPATTFLGADVSLANTSTVYDGPNTGAIGAVGQIWLIVVSAAFSDAGLSVRLRLMIHDGSSYIADTTAVSPGLGSEGHATAMAVVTLSAATTFTLKAKCPTSSNAVLLTSGAQSVQANKATSITAVRLA